MCILDEPECDPIHCPRAKGHFDRINAAVYEMLTECDSYTREEVLRQAEKWNVCPHELQFDVASWVDGVICDYNYAFDPTSKLKRFFAEGTKGDYIFLIDEAHNLVERGRDMFSATLVKEEILKVRQLLRPYAPGKKLEGAEPLQSPDARLQKRVRFLHGAGKRIDVSYDGQSAAGRTGGLAGSA